MPPSPLRRASRPSQHQCQSRAARATRANATAVRQRRALVADDLLRFASMRGPSDHYNNNNNNNNNNNSTTYDDDDDDEPSPLCDVILRGGDGALVPAIRYVLACRSAVWQKLLYGPFREGSAKCSGSVNNSNNNTSDLLIVDMPNLDGPVLRAVLHFCAHHELLTVPSSTSIGDTRPPHCVSTELVRHWVDVARAADYLALPALEAMAHEAVRERLVRDPSVACTILQHAADARLGHWALRAIENRPYVTLDVPAGEDDDSYSSYGGITELASPTTLEQNVLANPAVGASESFLLHMLARWYDHHVARLALSVGTNGDNSDNDNKENNRSSDVEHHRGAAALLTTTRKMCDRCLRLDAIDPSQLLSMSSQYPWISRDGVFDALARQALRAARTGTWHLPFRRGLRRLQDHKDECVLVEGAGHADVNGLYYRIAAGQLAHGESDLYSKREVACGQHIVYTLSRCRSSGGSTSLSVGDRGADIVSSHNNSIFSNNYECRIFCSTFLTHGAVQRLDKMQRTDSFAPFAPIMQLVGQLIDPRTKSGISAGAVPVPIRKYHRVRLSDGVHSIFGTLSREVGTFVDRGDLKLNYVLQIQEFGLYTIESTDREHDDDDTLGGGGHTGIHVIRAAIVSAVPDHRFGDPVPLEEAMLSSWAGDNASVDSDEDEESTSLAQFLRNKQPVAHDYYHTCTSGGLRTLYFCQYTPTAADHLSKKIPPTGWQVDDHGKGPAPICTWIPAMVTTATDDNEADLLLLGAGSLSTPSLVSSSTDEDSDSSTRNIA